MVALASRCWYVVTKTQSGFRRMKKHAVAMIDSKSGGWKKTSAPSSTSGRRESAIVAALNSPQFSGITVHCCPQSERLPVGRTCFRRIDLPDYGDKAVLRAKLLLALATLDASGFLLQ